MVLADNVLVVHERRARRQLEQQRPQPPAERARLGVRSGGRVLARGIECVVRGRCRAGAATSTPASSAASSAAATTASSRNSSRTRASKQGWPAGRRATSTTLVRTCAVAHSGSCTAEPRPHETGNALLDDSTEHRLHDVRAGATYMAVVWVRASADGR